MITQIIFLLILIAAGYFFYWNVREIARNIRIGKDIKINDNRSKRWKLMFKVAIGQSKMTVRPVSGIMHILVYAGFIIVNIEMLEILIDGIFGTHRLFAFFGNLYYILGSVECTNGNNQTTKETGCCCWEIIVCSFLIIFIHNSSLFVCSNKPLLLGTMKLARY